VGRGLPPSRALDFNLSPPISSREEPRTAGDARSGTLTSVDPDEVSEPGSTPPDSPVLTGERFQILELLGRGGMGEVYRAWDRELEVPVALKSLRPSVAHDPAVLARFRREAKLARRIKHARDPADRGP